MSAVKDAIRKLAATLGFERVGFCAAEKTPRADFLDTWLNNGWHGTMDWIARTAEWRKDIRTRYDWARSFVVLNIDYPAALPEKLPKKSALPNIARYARGADYHDIYKEPLKQLQEEIRKLGGPEAQAMWYQDTGPFLERPIAQQAGLGWVGKNTMLIDPKRGSWSFLALIVTSLELPPDTPGTDHCGTCTRCLDACPTDAFPAPYQLDASRCISYLTIEHDGPIEESLRADMGSWIFGCDICNEVCPWNNRAPAVRPGPQSKSIELDQAIAQAGELADLTLAKIFTAKPEHLKKRIAGTPLERTGINNLRRNAAIAAGNLQDESLLPSLEQALQTDDETLQEAVIWALSRYGSKQARAALARAQKHVVDEQVREKIIQALQPGLNGSGGPRGTETSEP